jgi:hypothetical protein
MLGPLNLRRQPDSTARSLMHGENRLDLQKCAFRRLHDLCNTPTAFK